MMPCTIATVVQTNDAVRTNGMGSQGVEVDGRTLVQPTNISISTDANATTTVLLDEGGALVAHFVDKDWFDPGFGLERAWPEDERRLLILQPVFFGLWPLAHS